MRERIGDGTGIESQWDAESSQFSAFDGKSQSILSAGESSNITDDVLLSPSPQFAGADKNLDNIEVSLVEDEKSKEQGEEWQKLLVEANRLKNRRL